MIDPATSLVAVVSFVGGIAAKWFSDWQADRRAAQREAIARQELRLDQRRTRTAEFQRENLLRLQDACMDLTRMAAQVHLSGAETASKTGQWGKGLIPGDLDQGFAEAQRATSTLMVRIRDPQVRDDCQELKAACTEMAGAKSELQSLNGLSRMMLAHERLNTRVGEVLRNLDEIE